MNEIVAYILVNKDLGMSVGKIAGQVAHAQAMIDELHYRDNDEPKEYKEQYQQWYHNESQKKIVLRAKEKTLLKAVSALGGIPVRDNGLTEIEKGSLTVVIFRPQPRENLTEFTRRLQLL